MTNSISSILCYIIQFTLISHILRSTVSAQPYEAFPITKQYPPIARADTAFSFQISNDTYKSNVDKSVQITYQSFGLPDWLSFDSNSRVFSGTVPSNYSSDLVSSNENYFFDFTLQGTDNSDGTSLNKTYQFVISNTDPIQLVDNFNLLAVLKNYGNTNGNNGLILSPNEVFNVTFDKTLFQNSGLVKQFYGRSQQYNAPLPNWLFFDSDSLKFSGTSPVINSQIAPEIYYDLVLIATEIEGFSDIEIPFSLIVGGHQLTTSIQNTILLNVTEDGQFNYDLPLNYVFLDDSPIQSTDLGPINLNDAPSWVQLTNSSSQFTLSGTLTDENTSGNNTFNVAIYDKYGDVIYLNFEVESTTNLFAVESLPNIVATRDAWFQYNFLPSQFTTFSKTNVSITYTNPSQDHSWLNFQSSNLTLQGLVPSDFDYLSVGLVAKESSLSQELDFQIFGINSTTHHNTTHTNHTTSRNHSSITLHHSHRSRATMVTSTRSSSLTSSSSSTASTTSAVNGTIPLNTQNRSTDNHNNKKTVAIACGVAIPVAVIAIILAIILFLWRQRRKQRDQNQQDSTGNDNKEVPIHKGKHGMVRDISGPSLNNAANNPNQTLTSLENPFDDDVNNNSNIDMALAGYGVNQLDQESITSSGSDSNYSNEKLINEKQDENRFTISSQDELLGDLNRPVTPADVSQNKNTSMMNPFSNRTSSFYLDAQPASKQSWRYNPEYNNTMNARDSMATLNTVSTSELLNTELKQGESIPKDPRKSTLALRDSVFWGGNIKNVNDANKKSLETLNETPSGQSPASSHSSSSTDDFVPVQNGDTFNWVPKNSPSRKPSQKRLVRLTSQSNVNVGQVQDVEGHVAEIV